MAERPDPKVIPQMRPGTLRDLVHRLAKDTANVSWSQHALDRMAERDIRDHVVLDVLRRGEIKGDIEPGKNPGEWKAKLIREAKGRREAGVVVLVVRNARLLVKTVEWEDKK